MGVVLSSIGSLVAGVSDPHGRSMYSSRTVGSPCPAGRTTPLNESATGTRSTFPTKNVCISKAFITTSTDLVIVSSSTHFFALLFVYFGLKLVRLYRPILLVIFDSMFIKWMRWTWPFIAGIGKNPPTLEDSSPETSDMFTDTTLRVDNAYVPGRRYDGKQSSDARLPYVTSSIREIAKNNRRLLLSIYSCAGLGKRCKYHFLF